MEDVNFYRGFEGEPELIFSYQNEGSVRHFYMWMGYFVDIIDAVEPEPEGWSSLAYCYHLNEGWYDQDNWPIPDLPVAINQIQSIELTQASPGVHQVRSELIAFLQAALAKGVPVLISYF